MFLVHIYIYIYIYISKIFQIDIIDKKFLNHAKKLQSK